MMKEKQVKLYVDDEYFDLVPRPSKEQRNAIKQSMIAEGQLEPITCDETGRILDGHTRFEICEEIKIKPKFIIKTFDNIQEKKNYCITINLKRRQLNDFQIYQLFEKQIEMMKQDNEKKRAEKIWATRRGEKLRDTYEDKQKNNIYHQTSELTGLPVHTVENIRYVKKHANARQLEEIEKGAKTIAQVYSHVRQKTPLNINYGKTLRSRFGIVFDIIRTLEENLQTNINFYNIDRNIGIRTQLLRHVLDVLITSKFVQVNTHKFKSKYYENKITTDYYVATAKGKEFFMKCKALYSYLPKEFEDK